MIKKILCGLLCAVLSISSSNAEGELNNSECNGFQTADGVCHTNKDFAKSWSNGAYTTYPGVSNGKDQASACRKARSEWPNTYQNKEDAVACCDTYKSGFWDHAHHKCVCLGGYDEFKVVNVLGGIGVCSTDLSGLEQRIKELERSNRSITREMILELIDDDLNQLRADMKSYDDINALVMKISSQLGTLDKTVWRTTDGKFNYARLGVDAGAGVVLGTVGGVVTATVMKKKQLENGLENIQCVIGGQNAAGYGDEFTITRQK